MDELILAGVLLLGAWVLKSRQQHQRIVLLGRFLGQYRIEKLMETVMDGCLRALGEADAERQAQIWSLLRSAEHDLAAQVDRLAADFATVDAAETRVSRLPAAIAYADRLFPAQTFDMRVLLRIHADGIRQAADSDDLSPKARAFTLSAELLLLQHSCHWYCRSKTVASARLLARHKTPHAQVLQAVSAHTRNAYRQLVGV